MSKAADDDGPDTLITIDREVPLWTDVGQGENRMRVDMLACSHPGPDSGQTADPYNAIELKCLIPSKETAETFWDRRVPTDVQKLTTTKMEPKWYRNSCHLWVLAIGVHNRKFKLPPGFHSHTIPIPSRVESKDAVVIAWWRKTLDAGGILRDFSGGH
jgi:hypothetical protein